VCNLSERTQTFGEFCNRRGSRRQLALGVEKGGLAGGSVTKQPPSNFDQSKVGKLFGLAVIRCGKVSGYNFQKLAKKFAILSI
jgi:hypothetical protein